MKHLMKSFQSHVGERGCHFYDSEHCNFLTWKQVFQFIDALPKVDGEDPFSEKLAETLANYNPDSEFLAVNQNGSSVSVELYAKP